MYLLGLSQWIMSDEWLKDKYVRQGEGARKDMDILELPLWKLLRDTSLLPRLTIIIEKWAVIRAEHRERPILQPLPDSFLVDLTLPRRWRAHTSCAFEARLIEVLFGQEQILRTGLGVDRKTS